MINKFFITWLICFMSLLALGQNIGINATGASPDEKAMLDIYSTTSGLLIPRMTTAQRDAIDLPPNGLLIYNITTNTQDIYRGSQWESVASINPSSNLVYVYSLADLPAPAGDEITLDANKMYVFSGFVDISSNYLNLNGAGLRGTDPGKDGVMSSVTGGVLRSTDVSVFIENLAVIPFSGGTQAYDFSDATGTKYCNLFSGCSVVEIPGTPSAGVGQISGFKAITVMKNFWSCARGIKVTGNVGKFASAYNFITGITSGAGIEFLAGLTIDDIDLSNNYFVYTGQTGIRVNAGATIDVGRMSSNLFRGLTPTTLITGFNSYSPGWEMVSNSGIPNSRTFGYSYMNSNSTSTPTNTLNAYVKVAGTTSTTTLQRVSAPVSNRLTYLGKRTINARVLIVLSGNSPTPSGALSVALGKNGTPITIPRSSISNMSNNQAFQLVLETEVSLATNDYVEVFIANNEGTNSYIIRDFQFRLID